MLLNRFCTSETLSAICEAVEAGFDVLVEKPAFVNHEEAINAIKKIREHKITFCEAFMFKHTTLYYEALEYWSRKRSEVLEIRITFLLPDLPKGTFRDDVSLKNSILFDVGCYAVTVLSDFSIPLEHIELDEVLMREMTSLCEQILKATTKYKSNLDLAITTLTCWNLCCWTAQL